MFNSLPKLKKLYNKIHLNDLVVILPFRMILFDKVFCFFAFFSLNLQFLSPLFQDLFNFYENLSQQIAKDYLVSFQILQIKFKVEMIKEQIDFIKKNKNKNICNFCGIIYLLPLLPML